MIIHIKNMVCVRCKMAVEAVLGDLEIPYLTVNIGKVVLNGPLSQEKLAQFAFRLAEYELGLMDNQKKLITDLVKAAIIHINKGNGVETVLKLSEYLSQQLQNSYTYLSNVFAETEGSTIEKFYITNRIEKVKELMVADGLTIKEISYRLNFSSVAHLSQQFKKVTGYTPAAYRKTWEKLNKTSTSNNYARNDSQNVNL